MRAIDEGFINSVATHTPGPWTVEIGFSDWGMPCSHYIWPPNNDMVDPETVITLLRSLTPYCLGASKADRDRAAQQAANARLIGAAPDMLAEILALRKENERLRGLCELAVAALGPVDCARYIKGEIE